MVMSTPILAKASKLMEESLLVDVVDLFIPGEPVTNGARVTRSLTPHLPDVPALVQTTVLQNAVESLTSNIFSVKVPQGTDVSAGMVAEVKTCLQEPSLVGRKLLLDKVSQNGVALIRKAVASDWDIVNQEGKESFQ